MKGVGHFAPSPARRWCNEPGAFQTAATASSFIRPLAVGRAITAHQVPHVAGVPLQGRADALQRFLLLLFKLDLGGQPVYCQVGTDLLANLTERVYN